MTSQSSTLSLNTRVRLLPNYIACLPKSQQAALCGREGVVTGYRLGATDPIVCFPATGRRKEIKLFEVSPRHMQVIV